MLYFFNNNCYKYERNLFLDFPILQNILIRFTRHVLLKPPCALVVRVGINLKKTQYGRYYTELVNFRARTSY